MRRAMRPDATKGVSRNGSHATVAPVARARASCTRRRCLRSIPGIPMRRDAGHYTGEWNFGNRSVYPSEPGVVRLLLGDSMLRTAIRRFLAAAFLTAWMAPPTGASTLLPLTLGDMVRDADAIIVGTVASANGRWLDGARRVIVTESRVDVDDPVLGSTGAAVTLTFWGGTIGDETQEIAGMPIPHAGERFVMFLRAGALSGQVAPTVGLFQGLLRVVVDPSTGAAVVREVNGGGLRPSIAAIDSGAVMPQSDGGSAMRLDAFLAALGSHMAELR